MTSREIFILMEDSDGTSWSGPEPNGFALSSSEQADIFLEKIKKRGGVAAIDKVRVFDTLAEMEAVRKKEWDEYQAELDRQMAEDKARKDMEMRVLLESNRSRPMPARKFSEEEKEMLRLVVELVESEERDARKE